MNDLKESAKVARTKRLIETQFIQMLEHKSCNIILWTLRNKGIKA